MRVKIAFLLIFIILLCSCANVSYNSKTQEKGEYYNKCSRGVWISYSEINNMLVSGNGFENELKKVVENCKSLEIENVYIHIRAFCDSIFESDYFPLNEKAKSHNFDVFEKIVAAFHQNNIKVHAWINPYRVLTSSSNIEALNHQSPAYKWLTDDDNDNDVNVCFSNGIYLNPAEDEVRKLIIDGIKEVLSRYKVDGIHFDDYFYPTQNSDFDSKSYEKYKKETEHPLKLEDWRRANVNMLISGSYSAVKSFNKDIIFSVSPTASPDKNYNEFYADVEEWIKNGYIDFVIPQLYFGFEYPIKEFEFENLLADWKKIIKNNSKVGLLIGLASYKIGTETEPDREEWQKYDDIIARQAEICFKDDLAQGYVIFSYSSIFSNNNLNKAQRQNLMQFIETEEN